jgi:hypothetical protein
MLATLNTMSTSHDDIPAEFLSALRAMRPEKMPSRLQLQEIRAPKSLTPYSAALAGEVYHSKSDASVLAEGSLTLLYSPTVIEEWNGKFRFASIVRASMDDDMAKDPLLYEVSRSWINEALAMTGADFSQLRGTVTVLNQEGFSDSESSELECTLELRASWTPNSGNPDTIYWEFKRHLESWINLLFTTAGSPMLYFQQ